MTYNVDLKSEISSTGKHKPTMPVKLRNQLSRYITLQLFKQNHDFHAAKMYTKLNMLLYFQGHRPIPGLETDQARPLAERKFLKSQNDYFLVLINKKIWRDLPRAGDGPDFIAET